MSKRKIEVFEYRNIIIQLRKNLSNRQVAKNTGASRNTIALIKAVALDEGWLAPNEALPSDYDISLAFAKIRKNNKKISSVDQYENKIKDWFEQGVSALVIHRALKENYSYNKGYQTVQRFIKTLKTNDNITVPLNFSPGEYAQVDFGKGPVIYDINRKRNISTWFFVMTLCFSRHQYCEIIEHQDIPTWLNCHKRAFQWFGGVPANITIDNAACAIAKASYTEPEPTKSYYHFAEEYDFIINACPPYDPEKKGIVESGVKYVKNNFMPLRSFNSIEDMNEQLQDWILSTAGNRIHGTTKKKPLNSFTETEKCILRKLPEHDVTICTWTKAKIYRDCHVKHKGIRYSAPYKYVNQTVWLCLSEATVKIYYDHKLIATHPRDPKNHNNISTITAHLPPKAKAFLEHDKPWCVEKAKDIGTNCLAVVNEILNSKHIDLLRSAQQLIYLKDKYGSTRLENACARAILFNTPRYGTVKSILKNGVDSSCVSDSHAFDNIAQESYGANSKYYREITSIKN